VETAAAHGALVCAVLALPRIAAAQCPPPGSGAAGVAAWAASCGVACGDMATTCNGEFTIQFTGSSTAGALVTFNYQICQAGGKNALSHWTVGLGQILGCVDESLLGPYGLNHLIAGAALDGMPLRVQAVDLNSDGDTNDPGEGAQVVIGLDLTTQLYGMKFNIGVADKGCHDWSITFDASFLLPGYTFCEGCAVGSVKAGNQDIRNSGQASPGYACIVGPECCENLIISCHQTDTAFAFGGSAARCFLQDGFNRWGWTNAVDATVSGSCTWELWAGAAHCGAPDSSGAFTAGVLIGTVTVDYDADSRVAVVTYDLAPGFGMSEAQVHVGCNAYPAACNGRNCVPEPTVAPGQFRHVSKFAEPQTEYTVALEVGDCNVFYVIAHAVVCMGQ